MGDKYDDIRAAVARADEALNCGRGGCRYNPPNYNVIAGRCCCMPIREQDTLAALYKAAKALVVAENSRRERWADAQANLASAMGLDNTLKTCWCFECLDDPSMGLMNPTMVRMITCPQCGNKRCPRATSHDNACSGSNEPGQDGSEK